MNWLQRTKNAAKQSISPLTDMQHVNRSVEQSVILWIQCTVLLQCYFNSLCYIICGKYKFPWHEDHSYFTFTLLDCDCFDVGLSHKTYPQICYEIGCGLLLGWKVLSKDNYNCLFHIVVIADDQSGLEINHDSHLKSLLPSVLNLV